MKNILFFNDFFSFARTDIGAREYTDPYYNIGRPKALNYGAFGYVLSHELAHSLDDNNRHVDKNGNLNPWFDSQSNKTFVERVQCLVKQYRKYGHDEFGFYVSFLPLKKKSTLVGFAPSFFLSTRQ